MIVMPSNNGYGLVHYLAGKYPGTIGWLMSPDGYRTPRPWLPFALDNGQFASWSKKREWPEDDFFNMLDRCKLQPLKPRFVVVPDEVADREATIYLWHQYEKALRRYGWPLAFAVQDGMSLRDIPKSADVVFIGGSTKWKWRNAALFCAGFPRVHIGRVNWFDKLEYCENVGAESCDGTGFFRGGEGSEQATQLHDFLAGKRFGRLQPELELGKGGILECGAKKSTSRRTSCEL
jgi:hypothetical protein